jgi:hypothetical protein
MSSKFMKDATYEIPLNPYNEGESRDGLKQLNALPSSPASFPNAAQKPASQLTAPSIAAQPTASWRISASSRTMFRIAARHGLYFAQHITSQRIALHRAQSPTSLLIVLPRPCYP